MKNLLQGLLLFLALESCASYQQFKHITQEFELPSKVLLIERHKAWTAVIDTMKRYDIEYQSQEAGIIKTRWVDNTKELNFADSFGNSDAIKSAKFKLIINVIKGQRFNREVTKITVYKRQLVEQDVLQGWKEIPSDLIQENTILYRIVRVLEIDKALMKLNEASNSKSEKNNE